MPRNVFRNGASLHRVLESAPIGHLKEFLYQADENFIPVGETVGPILAGGDDGPEFRKLILNAINELPMDHAEPVEVECRRILELSETKGPTSLRTIIERRLSHEECLAFDDQPGDLAKSLWAHVHHRREFDDAVSFKAIRSWRNAGRLFAAFNVDLDGKAGKLLAEEIDTGGLRAAVEKKLGTNRPVTISLLDLLEAGDYPQSVLVIVRFAGEQASVATHGTKGERRLIYYLPQDEAILIYTPSDERIEVAAAKAAQRVKVAEAFAAQVLNHDLSAKPLTSATYETHRFLASVELPLPDVVGFVVTSAKVVDLELRVGNWQSRLQVRAGGKAEMSKLVGRYLGPGPAFKDALGVSRVLIAVGYRRGADEEDRVLEIMISDGNSSSLNSERDPVIRNFGRKLLGEWGITRAFRDLGPTEAIDLLAVMAELWDLDLATQRGGYFSARGIATKPLEDARLIRRREIEPQLIEEEVDETVEGPSDLDRTIFAVDLDWVQERLVTALRDFVDLAAQADLGAGLAFVGTMQIDDRDVPCYLAKGLGALKTFGSIDERLRARAGLGPGIVFTGRAPGPALVGASVIVPLVASRASVLNISVDRDALCAVFRSGRSLALGAGTLELVKEDDDSAARLYFPGRDPLDLFGRHQVRAFDLLVDAAREGRPGVKAGDLIAGSSSAGFQQMFSNQRWRVVEGYVEQPAPRRWKLKGY